MSYIVFMDFGFNGCEVQEYGSKSEAVARAKKALVEPLECSGPENITIVVGFTVPFDEFTGDIDVPD